VLKQERLPSGRVTVKNAPRANISMLTLAAINTVLQIVVTETTIQ
jgi:hypothetical protein